MAAAGSLCAALGLASAVLWKWERLQVFDRWLLLRIHLVRIPPSAGKLLLLLRPLGSGWATMVLAGVLALRDIELGVSLAGTGLVCGALVWMAKRTLSRPRPYQAEPGVRVQDRRVPGDASMPSGDAARVWLLWGALWGLPVPAWAVVLGALGAAIVSIGRVKHGFHYPLDVWAGGWLGLGLGWLWVGAFAS